MLNGLIAIGAIFLALLHGGPGDVELLAWEFDLEITCYSIALHADPVFLVWTDREIPGAAMTFGNTIIAERWLQASEKRAYILRYEENHVRQCRALGWMMWPAALFVDMDPFRSENPVRPEWANPTECDALMWMPPTWWRDQWHWITLELRFG